MAAGTVNTEERIRNDSKFRCELITQHLFVLEQRDRLYRKLQAYKCFPEFLQIRQGDLWLSFDMLVAQFRFPYKAAAGKKLSDDDLVYVVDREAEYRERQGYASRLVGLAEQAHKLDKLDLAKQLATVVVPDVKVRPDLDGKALYAERKNRPQGILTGIKRIDDVVKGISYGTIYTVCGAPGAYKTITMNNIVYNGLCLGYNSAVIELELPRDMSYNLFLARHSYNPKFTGSGSPVNSQDILKCLLTPEQEKFLFDVVEPDFKKLPGKMRILEESDIPGWDYLSLRALMESMPFFVDLFAMDYVQLLMLIYLGFGDPRDGANWVINEFRKLAIGNGSLDDKRIGLLVSQPNRDGQKVAIESEPPGKYNLLALADLNQLDRASTYVQFLYVDDALKAAGEAKTQLFKHRGGETIQEPFTIPVDPRYAAIGNDIEGYTESETKDTALGIFSTEGGFFK